MQRLPDPQGSRCIIPNSVFVAPKSDLVPANSVFVSGKGDLRGPFGVNNVEKHLWNGFFSTFLCTFAACNRKNK
jgi:hypothetical protein